MGDVVEDIKGMFKTKADGNLFAIITGAILIAVGAFLIAIAQALPGTIILLTGIIIALF